MKRIFKKFRSFRIFRKIKSRTEGNKILRLFWIFTLSAVLSGSLAVVTHLYGETLFGWTATVHRERREIAVNDYISINSADMPLDVRVHGGGRIIVEYIGETALLIDEDELELKISREEDFALSLFSRNKLSYKMTVYLPDIQYEEIKLSSASGDIFIENVRSHILSATSRSGNIKTDNVEAVLDLNTRFGIIDTTGEN